MEKIINGIKIEYEKEDKNQVTLICEKLNEKSRNIMDFFELTEVKNFKIKIWDNKAEYVTHLKGLLDKREYAEWMIAHTYDGNINILPLRHINQDEFNQNETEEGVAINACHEFVHICQQQVNKDDSEGWFLEMLATNLGNPENYGWCKTEFKEYIHFDELKDMNYLVENFDKINGYKYVYLMGQYLLDNKPHSKFMEWIKDSKVLHKERQELFEECKEFYRTYDSEKTLQGEQM